MTARISLFLKLAIVLLLPGSASAERSYSVPPGINVLSSSARLVDNFVKARYPEAQTHAFEGVIHFEHATGLHVLPAISKNPKPPKVPVRGPVDGGVWCDIDVVAGGLDRIPAYSRAEGAFDRGPFTEHLHYVAPPLEPNHHLIVTVRLPKDAGEEGTKFVEALRKQLEKFRIDRQTIMPSAR